MTAHMHPGPIHSGFVAKIILHTNRLTLATRWQNNSITLSEKFYNEIDDHPIPVERRIVAALANAPGALDFYIWLSWKSWHVNEGAVSVPLFGPHGLSLQLGTKEYSTEKRFRQMINEWLRKLKTLWPECSAEVSKDGRFLVVRPCKQYSAIRSLQHDGHHDCTAAN